jgi:hypothetical protein
LATQHKRAAHYKAASEHCVFIGRRLWHDLEDVPVFDDSAAVVEAEDVDPGPIMIAGPVLQAMQHDVIALGDDSFELNTLSGIVLPHPREVFDESVLAVRDGGVVLDVDVASLFLDGFVWAALVKHQVVKSGDGGLVLINVGHRRSLSPS